MTATPILEALAQEFSCKADHIRNTLEMLDAGLVAPYIGRVRREASGDLTENTIRRLLRRRDELVELDRRRATILRMLESVEGISPAVLESARNCMDRFDLEDLFLPHRRPEPEVQLALDRGLAALADELVKPIPRAHPSSDESEEGGEESEGGESVDPAEGAQAQEAQAVTAQPGASSEAEPVPDEPSVQETPAELPTAGDSAVGEGGPELEQPADAVPPADPAKLGGRFSHGGGGEPVAPEPATGSPPAGQPQIEGAPAEPTAGDSKSPAQHPSGRAPSKKPQTVKPKAAKSAPPITGRPVLTPELARVCAAHVNPDKGVHVEEEALAGAERILSDRLGRDPHLRGLLRRILRKYGELIVRPTVDERRLGRHKPLLKVRQRLRQLQGHRLLAIRQAQKERLITTLIELDRERAFPKVRAALGRRNDPGFSAMLDTVAEKALHTRLLPMVEADVRLELKERGDEDALRFLGQHLREILLSPPAGRRGVLGVDVNAKGDWTVVALADDGSPLGAETRIQLSEIIREPSPAEAEPEKTAPTSPEQQNSEQPSVKPPVAEQPSAEQPSTDQPSADQPSADQPSADQPSAEQPSAEQPAQPEGERALRASSGAPAEKRAKKPAEKRVAKKPAELGAELQAAMGNARIDALAVGHGKIARLAVTKLRAALEAVGSSAFVFIVNEAGLSSYANSELARNELPEHTVPGRMAISLARRYQDPIFEILKVDPRHLGLGSVQGLVSKANLRRVFRETIESCVAHVGCDVNTAPVTFLRHVPGMDLEAAKRLVQRRAERSFANREELRADGLLNEAQWVSSIAFLRVPGSEEPLDSTGLHPDQYPMVRRLIEATGSTVAEALGSQGATRGMRRADFGIDEHTWRDMMREVSRPGRDPRPRLFAPAILPPWTEASALEKNQVVEGLVSNATSFGAFVDIGLDRDAMIHISEISDHYVRDARELLAIGQAVRTRVLETGGQRVTLSLKKVPLRERPGRGAQRGQRGQRGGGRGEDRPRTPERPVRAAQSRRDGMAGGRSEFGGGRGGGGRGGGGGGRGGGGRGGGAGGRGGGGGGAGRGGFGGRGGRRGDEERVDPAVLREASKSKSFTPFATFFKKDKDEDEPEASTQPSTQPSAQPSTPSSTQSSTQSGSGESQE